MKRILVVDDDPGIQDAFTVMFDPQEYQLIVYPNGNQVLKNDFPVPDLFILDKQLSGVDGLDICTFIKSQPHTRQIPVIMLSASPHIHQLAEQAGADAALEKPFSLQHLRQLVAKLLT